MRWDDIINQINVETRSHPQNVKLFKLSSYVENELECMHIFHIHVYDSAHGYEKMFI